MERAVSRISLHNCGVVRFVLVTVAVTLLAGATSVGAHARVAAVDVPTVGDDLGTVIQTCERGRGHITPTSAQDCLTWGGDTPVNVVVVMHAPDNLASLAPAWSPAWRPAQGHWLVARGRVLSECGTASSPATTLQIEQRLDPVTRYHVKFAQMSCTDGVTRVAFGNAHTDLYEKRRCGGDRAVSFDAAREAFVRAVLKTTPRARVVYRSDHSVSAVYQGGCGQRVSSDGRVAYLVVG
jgi:hypothetical protein